MKKNIESAQEWFKKAESDFNYAKAGFKETEFYDTACFLSHQVVEKYLKGFLIANNISPQRTHKLTVLLKECFKINKNFENFLEECKILNDYYVPSRYPGGEIFSFKKEQAQKALEITEEIIKFIKENI